MIMKQSDNFDLIIYLLNKQKSQMNNILVEYKPTLLHFIQIIAKYNNWTYNLKCWPILNHFMRKVVWEPDNT